MRFPGGWGSQILRQSAHEGGKIVSSTRRPHLLPRNTPSSHFCYRLIRPQGHSAVGRIMSKKVSNYSIGVRTRDLPACSAVPQTRVVVCEHFLSCWAYYLWYLSKQTGREGNEKRLAKLAMQSYRKASKTFCTPFAVTFKCAFTQHITSCKLSSIWNNFWPRYLRQDCSSPTHRVTSTAISNDVTRVTFTHENFWRGTGIILTDDQFQASQKQSES